MPASIWQNWKIRQNRVFASLGPKTRFLHTEYARAGRTDSAVSLLARALATPGVGTNYSPAMLWIDPAWDPIRGDPRFQALMAKLS